MIRSSGDLEDFIKDCLDACERVEPDQRRRCAGGSGVGSGSEMTMEMLVVLCAVIAISGIFTIFFEENILRLVFFVALLSTVGLKMLGAILTHSAIQWTDFAVFAALFVGVASFTLALLRKWRPKV